VEQGQDRRPSAVVHGWRLQGELKVIAACLKRPVIEEILKHLGPEPPSPHKAPERELVPYHAG